MNVLFNSDGSILDSCIPDTAATAEANAPADTLVLPGVYVLLGITEETGWPETFSGKCLLSIAGTTQTICTSHTLFANSKIWYRGDITDTWRRADNSYSSEDPVISKLKADVLTANEAVARVEAYVDGLLTASGKIKESALPETLTHNKGIVATEADLPKNAVNGDYATVLETNTVWTYTDGKWTNSNTAGTVTSINGKTGDITVDLSKSDVSCTSESSYADRVNFSITSTSDSDGTTRTYYPFHNIKNGDNYGHGLMIESAGAMVVSAGEGGSASLAAGAPVNGSTEHLYLTSDNDVYIYVGQQSGHDENKKVTIKYDGSVATSASVSVGGAITASGAATIKGALNVGGAATVGGNMTASGNVRAANGSLFGHGVYLTNSSITKGTKPASTQYSQMLFYGNTSSGLSDRIAMLETSSSSAGEQTTYITAYKFEKGSTANASIGVAYPLSGTAHGFAPNPAATSDTNDIATTAWVRDRITVSTSWPSGGSNGDIWFKYY